MLRLIGRLGFSSDFRDFGLRKSKISTKKLSNGFLEAVDLTAHIHFGNPTLEF